MLPSLPQACPRPASFYLNPQSQSNAARAQRRTSATFRPSPLAGPVLSFDSLPLMNISPSISEDGLLDVEQANTPTRQGPKRSVSEDASTFERRQLQAGLGWTPIARVVGRSLEHDAQSYGSHSTDSASITVIPPLPTTMRKASSSSLSSHKERDLRRLSLTASLSPSLSSSSSMQSVSRSISTSSRFSDAIIPELHTTTSPSNASLALPKQLRPRRRSTLGASSSSVSKQRSSTSLAELAAEELEQFNGSAGPQSSVRYGKEVGVQIGPKAAENGNQGSNAPNDKHNWFTAEPIPVFSRSAIKTQGIIMPIAASSSTMLHGHAKKSSSTSLKSGSDSPSAARSPNTQRTTAALTSEKGKLDQQPSMPQQLEEKKVMRRASLGHELKRSFSRKFTLSLNNTSRPSVSRTPPEPVPLLPILAYSKDGASASRSIPHKGESRIDPKARSDEMCKDFEGDLVHTVRVHVTSASSTSSNSSLTPSVDISRTSTNTIRRAWRSVRSRSRKRSPTMPQECGEKEKATSNVVKRRPSAISKKAKRFPLVHVWP